MPSASASASARAARACLLLAAAWAALAGADAPPAADANLLPNGELSEAAANQDPPGPAHWDRPDGLGVQWCAAPDGGKAIRIDTRVSEIAMEAQWKKVGITTWDIPTPTAATVAENTGLSFYSDPIAIAPGKRYRVSFESLGPPGGIKVWVRGYATVDGEERRQWEHIIMPTGAPEAWRTTNAEVAPTAHRPDVRTIRIMLFAYYPAQVYWFRHLRVVPLP